MESVYAFIFKSVEKNKNVIAKLNDEEKSLNIYEIFDESKFENLFKNSLFKYSDIDEKTFVTFKASVENKMLIYEENSFVVSKVDQPVEQMLQTEVEELSKQLLFAVSTLDEISNSKENQNFN